MNRKSEPLGCSQSRPKRKVIAICTHIKKSNNLMIHLRALRKQQLIPEKVARSNKN